VVSELSAPDTSVCPKVPADKNKNKLNSIKIFFMINNLMIVNQIYKQLYLNKSDNTRKHHKNTRQYNVA
jgi:hypothetical protein